MLKHGLNLPEVIEKHDAGRAVASLRNYYWSRYPGDQPSEQKSYTGAWFDEFDPSGTRSSHPNEFTADDLVSVELLSVRVPGVAVRRLLLDPDFGKQITDLLERIPVGMPIWDAREPVDEDWAPWRLENLLRSVDRIDVTTASKLIARKRPNLYPVNDKVVRKLVRPDSAPKDWSFVGAIQGAFQDGDLREFLAKVRQKAGLPDAVPLLRIFDVLAWMQIKG
ncbi:DUF6308 family protein [Corynebacterium variabile]|uniref:DUF6308 family protein n=1 Tax=Corynebacterium variabile TaxID=1727 RepID=UPI0028A0D173|nr:DUF6308 family protein [Corynebacterium variabile]